MRSDGSDSLMPVSCMPVGLIEYIVSFFSAETMYQVCYLKLNVYSKVIKDHPNIMNNHFIA